MLKNIKQYLFLNSLKFRGGGEAEHQKSPIGTPLPTRPSPIYFIFKNNYFPRDDRGLYILYNQPCNISNLHPPPLIAHACCNILGYPSGCNS